MIKLFYIILISLFCVTINSCAEIDKSFDSAKSFLTQKILVSGYDILIGNTLMSSNNLYGPEKTSTEQGANTNPKNNNIFLVKQDSFGNREWAIDLEISVEESGISMTFDSSDNVYITRATRNGLEENKDLGDFTVFLVKYNSNGIREWIKKLGRSEDEYGSRLIVDSSDNIYVTGFFSKFESDNEFGSWNTLLAKYDTLGNREWTKPLGSILTDVSWDVTVDSKDNIYVTGISDSSFVQNTGLQGDILLMKFNTDGIKL